MNRTNKNINSYTNPPWAISEFVCQVLTLQLLQLSLLQQLPPSRYLKMSMDARVGPDILLLVVFGDFSSIEAQKPYCFCSPSVSLAHQNRIYHV